MKNTTLLIADDNDAVRRVLARSLSGADRTTLQAADGLATLETARARRPDAILLDVRMPGMSGFDVCRELRADERTRAIPIIMISGLCDADHQVEGLDVGADDYVVKPFNLNELSARIDALLLRCQRPGAAS